MIAFARIDNRLIHGQVIEAWVPALNVGRILVVDDQAAGNPLTRAAMGLAVPASVPVRICTHADSGIAEAEQAPEKTLLLVREVADAVKARSEGLRCPALNVGNVHFGPGRLQVTPSVFLARDELAQLRELQAQGVKVELRTLPKDKALGLAEIEQRIHA